MSVQPGRNGGTLNRGGNEGNVFGGGAKPKKVRLKYLDGADVGADYSRKVAKGLKCILVPDEYAKKPIYRYPTHAERMDAIKECNRMGLPLKVELTGADEGPVQVEQVQFYIPSNGRDPDQTPEGAAGTVAVEPS